MAKVAAPAYREVAAWRQRSWARYRPSRTWHLDPLRGEQEGATSCGRASELARFLPVQVVFREMPPEGRVCLVCLTRVRGAEGRDGGG